MRFIFLSIFLLIAAFIAHQFMPWWSIAVIAAILSFIFKTNASESFWVGFLTAALLWGGYAAYLDKANEGILTTRIGNMLGGLSGIVLVILSGVIGGIFGGLGALTGSLGRQLLK